MLKTRSRVLLEFVDPNLIDGNMPVPMPIRAIRGAITASENSREAILEASSQLLEAIIEANDLHANEVVAATFSATEDLNRAYPAEAARSLGWTEVALLCVQEMHVEGSLDMCIRVRVLIEKDLAQADLDHQYMRGAVDLRKDWQEK